MREQGVAAGLSVILVLMGVAGLAGSSLGLGTADPDHHVHIEGSSFDPETLIVRPGEVVEWDNHDSVPHDATADNGDWATKQAMSEGESDTVLFQTSGTWSYHCTVHPSITGSLTVNLPAETTITSHADQETVDGLITLEGTASDADGSVEYVEIRIGGGDWENTTGTANWSYDWDTLQEPNGARLVEVRAYDGAEHSEPTAITLNVDNPLFVDLEITSDDLQTQSGPTSTQIVVTVHNQGNEPAQLFTLLLEYDYKGQPHLIEEVTVEALDPFTSHEFTVDWDTLGKIGDFDVSATADPDGDTGDIDPSNNQGTTTASILVSGIDGIDLFDP